MINVTLFTTLAEKVLTATLLKVGFITDNISWSQFIALHRESYAKFLEQSRSPSPLTDPPRGESTAQGVLRTANLESIIILTSWSPAQAWMSIRDQVQMSVSGKDGGMIRLSIGTQLLTGKAVGTVCSFVTALAKVRGLKDHPCTILMGEETKHPIAETSLSAAVEFLAALARCKEDFKADRG